MEIEINVSIITKRPSDKVYNKEYLKTLETKKWGFYTRDSEENKITHKYIFKTQKLFKKFVEKNSHIIVKIKINDIKLIYEK